MIRWKCGLADETGAVNFFGIFDFGELVEKFFGFGVGTGRVAKNMNFVKADFLTKSLGLFEIFLIFTGEADDNVSSKF